MILINPRFSAHKLPPGSILRSPFFHLALLGYNGEMDPVPSENTEIPFSEETLFAAEKVEVPQQEFFLFELDGELYAVSVKEIELVMKIPPVTAVPNAPDSIVGIFHLRGRVIVVLDLLKRMGLPRNRGLVPYYLFVASQGKNHYGVLVDRTRTVVRVPELEITPLDSMTAAHVPERYVKGKFLYQERMNMRTRLAGSQIMITPISALEEELAVPQFTTRPVVILNLGTILNEEEVRRSAEKQPSDTPPSQPV